MIVIDWRYDSPNLPSGVMRVQKKDDCALVNCLGALVRFHRDVLKVLLERLPELTPENKEQKPS